MTKMPRLTPRWPAVCRGLVAALLTASALAADVDAVRQLLLHGEY